MVVTVQVDVAGWPARFCCLRSPPTTPPTLSVRSAHHGGLLVCRQTNAWAFVLAARHTLPVSSAPY